jgi:biotin/methionine sulfoxide reductase
MQQAIAPVGEARSDFAIFSALAQRLGCAEAYTQGRGETEWLRHLYGRWRDKLRTNHAIPEFDEFWATGFVELPRRADDYVMLAEFRDNPEQKRLGTPSGRIELYSERIAGFGYDDCPPHPTWLAPAEWLGGEASRAYPLHLVSSQPRYRLHSQMDGGPVSARGKVDGREAVAINPADAARRGIADGDVVRVFNARGACLAGAVVTDAVTPGVLRLSCGAWYDPVDDGAESICAHGNANVLTFDRGTSRLGQGPSSATTLVEIERYAQAAPPVRAFVPPVVESAA